MASDQSSKASPAKGVDRDRLDRDRIVAAALDYIDRHGAQGLSMRALAHELDVVPMALYRHIRGREDLLEAVVSVLLAGVRRDLDDELAKTGWQGYLQTLANSVRRIAVEHAAAFPLVATRHPSAPWLRPPLRSIELVGPSSAPPIGSRPPGSPGRATAERSAGPKLPESADCPGRSGKAPLTPSTRERLRGSLGPCGNAQLGRGRRASRAIVTVRR